METNSRNKNTIILSIICILSNISYYPIMVQNKLGRKIAIVVWILLGGYLLISRFSININNIFIVFLIMYVLFCVNTLIVGYVNNTNAFQNHFFLPITIATVIFVMANMLGNEINKEHLKQICIVYFFSMAIIAILLFFKYLRGSDLSSSIYEYRYGKNEVSVLLLCALIIDCIIYKPINRTMKIFKIIAALFILLDIAILRARSVFLGVGLLVCIIVFYKHNINKKMRYVIIISMIIISCYFILHKDMYYMFINRIIYAGRDASDINDLSSGRSETIVTGIATFLDNPLFGIGKRGTLDCFYVSILVNYGLLGIPAIIMAVMPFLWSIRNLKNHNDIDLCFFTITASVLIISILEELAPFGSGTRCYILWLIWGILLSQSINVPSKQDADYEIIHHKYIKNWRKR